RSLEALGHARAARSCLERLGYVTQRAPPPQRSPETPPAPRPHHEAETPAARVALLRASLRDGPLPEVVEELSALPAGSRAAFLSEAFLPEALTRGGLVALARELAPIPPSGPR